MPSRKRTPSSYPTTAIQDVPDLRDWPFEASLKQLRRYVTPPRGLQILDQQQEGACTGFGLAAVINLLNKRRGSRVRVSPRMLYEMAKLHDEWPGEQICRVELSWCDQRLVQHGCVRRWQVAL